MQILLCMRSKTQRTKNNSLFILNLFALQFISLISLNRLDSFYLKIASYLLILIDEKLQFSPFLIIVHAGFNALIIILLIIAQLFKNMRFRQTIILFLGYTILNFKYIFLIPVACINVLPLISPDIQVQYKVICAFNMIVTFAMSAVQLYTNWSNRFIQKDFCNRRQNSILCLFFQFGFVFSTIIFGSLVGGLFLIAVSIFRAYQVIITVEYKLIQSSTFFYSALNIYMCIICLVGSNRFQFLDFTFKIIIGVIVCQYFSVKSCNFINSWYGNSKSLYSINKPQLKSSEKSQNQIIEADQENKSIGNYKDLIILSRIFLSRKQMEDQRQKKIIQENQWHLWWQKFMILLAYHFANCTHQKCECRKGKLADQNKIIMQDMRRLMALLQSIQKQPDKRIMGIYLNIQITDKPLKAYYQIINMKRQETSPSNFIDLQVLLIQTRECFSKIFLIHNIQNSGLPLMKIVRYQQLIESLENQLKIVLEANINFNQLFTLNSIKINQIVNDSKKIFEIKQKINNKFEDLVVNYPDSLYVSFLIFLYFQYLQVYRSKQKQLKIISQQKNLKRRLFQKDQQDIFSSSYGVIYIDLVQQRGKIKKITKNICKLYGYNYQDMIQFNIKQFMPQIYGKNHHKFLTNFIEFGKIKLLSVKNRLIFAKSKSKYIFPIIVRMKTQHLLNTEFGVTALINKMETLSEFILFGNNGKIEQMTQKIFKLIFHQAFKSQIDKTRRLCLIKMLPNLIKILADPEMEAHSEKIHQSTLIFSNYTEMIDRFKIFREAKKYGSRSGSNSSFVGSSSLQIQQTSQLSLNASVLPPNYYADVFKAFLHELNIIKLNAYTLRYKVSKLRTEEFSIFQLEVLSIQNSQNPFNQAIGQYRKIAQHLNIYEEHGPIGQNFQKFRGVIQRNDVLNFMFNKNIEVDKYNRNALKHFKSSYQNKNKKKITIVNQIDQKHNKAESIPESSVANNFNELPNNLANQELIQRGGSERSSVTDQTQSQTKKQMLINAFNCDNCGINNKFLYLINLVIVGMLGILLVFVIQTINEVQTINAKQIQEFMNLYSKQIYEYRLSSSKISQLFTILSNRNFTLPENYFSSQHSTQVMLNNQFTQTILMINKLNQFSNHLQDTIPNINVMDPYLNAQVQMKMIQLLDQLDSKFRQQPSNQINYFFQVNYQAIHNWFLQINSDNDVSVQNSSNIGNQQIIVIVLGIYQFVCVIVAVLWIPALYLVSKKEKRIINLLSTMNIKQLKRATQKLKLLLESIKSKKLSQINSILALLSDEKLDNVLELQKQKSIVRNIRLVQQADSYTIKPRIVVAFITVFIMIFSLLPIFYYMNLHVDQVQYKQTLNLMKLTCQLSDKAPMMTNLYLTNINKVYKNQSIINFSESMYNEAQDNYFDIQVYIASIGELSASLVNQGGKDSNFTNKICLQIPCTPKQLQQSNRFYDQIVQIRNKLMMLHPTKLNLSSSMPLSQLDEFFKTTDTLSAIYWIHKLYLFTNLWSERFKKTIEDKLTDTQTELIIIGAILIPVYVFVIFYVESWLIKKMAEVLKDAESIHMNFPVQILAQNTYLTSYFNDKIKNSK